MVDVKKSEEKRIDIDKPQTDSPLWETLFPSTIVEFKREIKFLFNLVLNRKGQWFGKTSYNFLLKQKTEDLSVKNLRKVYMLLPQETSYFTKEKTSIIITDEGKRIASFILKNNDE
jgi:hypothetical protein